MITFNFKRLFLAFAVFILGIAGTSANAAEDWRITNFDSAISIQTNGIVQITETVKVDFGQLQKHGIFRDMPVTYAAQNGEKRYTSVDVKSITNGTKNIPYRIERNTNNMRIVIGDANATINGKQTYIITYQVTGALTPFDTYDELYWNTTGLDWQVPIDHVTATVSLPDNIKTMQSACYKGGYGSTKTCEKQVINDSVTRFSTNNLKENEGLTVAVGYPKGQITLATVESPKPWYTTRDGIYAIAAFFVTLIVGLSIIFRQWWKYGRDWWSYGKNLRDTGAEKVKPLGTKEIIVAEYDPPAQLRPAELGTLLDERADATDISATIVDLAVRGYLTITEIPKKWILGQTDYRFDRTQKSTSDLLSYEQTLLSALFKEGKTSVTLSSLRNKFYKELPEIQTDLYEEVTKKKLFFENPKTIRNRYLTIAVVIIVISAIAIPSLTPFKYLVITGLAAAGIVIGLVALLLAQFMPRRTAYGRELYRQALGYKEFIGHTEKYRQPFFERQNIFMDVLPYAMVFGVTKQLARAFEEMGYQPSTPNWYVSSSPFNPVLFTSQMETFSHTLSSAIASSPSSSGSGGGGFSGGGMGGGGGGSW